MRIFLVRVFSENNPGMAWRFDKQMNLSLIQSSSKHSGGIHADGVGGVMGIANEARNFVLLDDQQFGEIDTLPFLPFRRICYADLSIR